MLTFHAAVVLGSTDSNPPVFDAKFFESHLKPCRFFAFLPEECVGELMAVIGLCGMDFERRGFDRITDEQTGGVFAQLGVYLPVTLAGILIDLGVLIQLLAV